MRTFLKESLTTIFLLFILTPAIKAQTNVSGGIYTNTTWTLAGSPYIVIDTVVVFPGVTLTIDPGVVVKFANSKRLEIRQASLIAIGTAVDSITFTSNSSSPTPGIWERIYFNQGNVSQLEYCNFLYATNAIWGGGTLAVRNSKFQYNLVGLGYIYYSVITVDSCEFRNNDYGLSWATGGVRMSNSRITNNQYGIYHIENSSYKHCIIDSNSVVGVNTSQRDTVVDCVIRYNGIGLENPSSGGGTPSFISRNIIENNTTGFKLMYLYDDIYCNKICNNTSY